MEQELRQLFASKGLPDEAVASIEANDGSLRTIDDLASGAVTEIDARSWAEELGLTARMAKARFVQSWLEARASLQLALQIAGAGSAVGSGALPPAAPDAAAPPALVGRRAGDAGEAAAAGDGPTWALSTRDAAQAQAPSHPSEPKVRRPKLTDDLLAKSTLQHLVPPLTEPELVSRPCGVSDPLRALLRASGLTSMEVRMLETSEAFRTCGELIDAASDAESAKRLARSVGISSKVSQENFARAWSECARASQLRRGIVADDDDPHGSRDYQLLCLHTRGELDVCAAYLMQHGGFEDRQELKRFAATMLAHIAMSQQAVTKRAAAHRDAERRSAQQAFPQIAEAYGVDREDGRDDADAAVAQHDEVDIVDAESLLDEAADRWRSTLRALFGAKFAIGLQKTLLQEYRSPDFRAACAELGGRWNRSDPKPDLEQKMRDIQALCFDKVLVRVLPRYGFAPHSTGAADMKAAIAQHMATDAEVRRLQIDISAAVMSSFQL